jgi:hypothetical protein
MGNFIERQTGFDADDLFAVTIPRVVRIRDFRLGLMQCGLQLAAFIYIFAVPVLENNGFLLKLPPTGSVEFTLQQPTMPLVSATNHTPCCDPRLPCESGCACQGGCTGPPCDYSDLACQTNFKSAADLDYCNKAGAAKCIYADGNEIGIIGDGSLFISTELNTSVQYIKTARTFPKTPWHTEEGSPTIYTTADIGDYTVKIRHSVQQIDLGISAQSNQMKGSLQVEYEALDSEENKKIKDDFCASHTQRGTDNRDTTKNKAPCQISPSMDLENEDYFTIRELLSAAVRQLESSYLLVNLNVNVCRGVALIRNAIMAWRW